MSRHISRFIVLVLIILLVWANIPARIPIQFSFQKWKINTAIEPLKIDIPLGNAWNNISIQTQTDN